MDNFDFSKIDPKIFVSSVASLINSVRSLSKAPSSTSTSLNQYALSLASFRHILIRCTKSLLLNDSFASI